MAAAIGGTIGGTTSSTTATNKQTLPIDNQPASFRYNNPGAQYPSKEAAKFGQLGYGSIDNDQFEIALFPNPVNGAAANFDLLNRNYTGMSIGEAGTKWTGSHGFGVPGYDPSIILTRDMLGDQGKAIDLLKAIAGRESGRGNNLTEEQWRRAHDMFQAGSADAYLGEAAVQVPANPVAGTPSGAGLLKRAREHLHERYDHVLVPKDDSSWKGPWDCSEFMSWLVYQEANLLYGCDDDQAAPSKAKAYTGDWQSDVEKKGKRVSVDQAAAAVGGILLRYPPGPGEMGHIVLCDGSGGTTEAKGKLYGVVADTVHNRPWDTGILIPGIQYGQGTLTKVTPPDLIYKLGAPDMDRGVIIRIQTALVSKGFNPGVVDGEFGAPTQSAVLQFQEAQGLTVDGQVGPETAAALGISLTPDDTAKPGGPELAHDGSGTPGGQDGTQVNASLMPLLTLILMLFSKEKPMAADPSKPGQNVDPIGLLIMLLLQSMLTGKQIDPSQLLGGIATGQLATPSTPAAPASGTKPAALPASGQGSPTQQQPMADLLTLLLPLIYQKITGQPLPATGTTTTTAGSTQTTGGSGTSVMTNPSVQIGAAGLAITTILQALGQLGTPFGMGSAPTFNGTLATLIPLVIAGFGATGGWGSLIGIGSSLLSAIANAANKSK